MNEIFFLNTPSIHIRFASNFALEKISDLLQAKGMNSEAAFIRAKEVFGEERDKASLYLHNLQVHFDEGIMNKIYDYISHKALFQEVLFLSSYDQLLRMVQNVYSTSLSEEELKKIKHISQANNYSIALIR